LKVRARFAVLILAGALCTDGGLRAQQVDIETNGQNNYITITASAEMRVDSRTVWNVLTDYDHLAEFIPYMRSSRVIQRDADRLLVEQTGNFGFLLFKQPVDARLCVVESPPRRIVAHAVGGNLKEMEGRYTLENLPSGAVRLSYVGRLLPDFPVPPLIGKMVVRNVLAKQFSALVEEIVRRDAQQAR
jgi:ribosome-associated toxin RatA of RatAB toxin-antitoxin module